jgi:photosystem II stability/assembly factor-like uncharacterized protein
MDIKIVYKIQRCFLLVVFLTTGISAAPDPSLLTSQTFSGLRLRNIGPAQRSGRISDIVKDPTDSSTWYVAVASGNLWKTVNNGTTWTPIFDNYGSYSIGCVTIDPHDPRILWLGTGENNSQRSVGYGDGVYKSFDAGKSWTCMGLESSEHIGKILVDPRCSQTVYVAAQGPLWRAGGERGLYRTVDGGVTWQAILSVSDNTGISDIAFDPLNPDILYATSYQRRRHVWTLVAGGPESAIYRSLDGGDTWKKIVTGLPSGDLGRIGIAVSPQQPHVVYATVPAAWDESGFFRSSDRGENWIRMSDYMTVDPQYYQELFPDPHRFDRVYCMDVFTHVTENGGKTWERLNSRFMHVDNHALVFDPQDPDYLMIGNDGGIYETWDRTRTWRYIANLPVTQFYRVGVDNSLPFYNVYGGTQDNGTLGGPSRTTTVHGIRNSDWFATAGGDGYQTRVDPDDPNILYSLSQYGALVRFDRRSGERLDIQPQPDKDEPPLIWNWDTPLIISPHASSRLYVAANILFRSDDRGNSWQAVSPDLPRQIDRNRLEVMGTVWGTESVWKNVWTSFYGNAVALDESALHEGLLYVGTDDGLIQVTEDGGGHWRKQASFPGIPEMTYVADLKASVHDRNTVYAVFNNHKRGDFTPYLLKSTDCARTWSSIRGDLPDRHVVWTIQEDPQRKGLLFAGTEFGLFFSIDGGQHWIQLKSGIPTIAVRDLEIQTQHTDLVCATFGRGILILDDYSPLRQVSSELLNRPAHLFPVKKTWSYIPDGPLGSSKKSNQGDAFFTAPNPPFGAIFTYYLKEGIETRRQIRKQAETKQQQENKPVYYPSWESLRREDTEDSPAIILTVTDEAGEVVRRLVGPASRGFHRLPWDLRYTRPTPIRNDGNEEKWHGSPGGVLALPGFYTVHLSRYVDGQFSPLGEGQRFEVASLGRQSLLARDSEANHIFQRKVDALRQAVLGLQQVNRDTEIRLTSLKQALQQTPQASESLILRTRRIQHTLQKMTIVLEGDRSVSSRFEPTRPSLLSRINRAGRTTRTTTDITTTHRREYQIALELFSDLRRRMDDLLKNELAPLEQEADAMGAPWTPGRGIPKSH